MPSFQSPSILATLLVATACDHKTEEHCDAYANLAQQLPHLDRALDRLTALEKAHHSLAELHRAATSQNDQNGRKLADVQAMLGRVEKIDHAITGIDDIILTTTRRSIPYKMTGHDVCGARGEICMFVLPTKASDTRDRFAGYVSPTCASKVRLDTDGDCWDDHRRVCVLDQAPFRRAANAEPGANVSSSSGLCVGNEGSRDTAACAYDYAVCASARAVR